MHRITSSAVYRPRNDLHLLRRIKVSLVRGGAKAVHVYRKVYTIVLLSISFLALMSNRKSTNPLQSKREARMYTVLAC